MCSHRLASRGLLVLEMHAPWAGLACATLASTCAAQAACLGALQSFAIISSNSLPCEDSTSHAGMAFDQVRIRAAMFNHRRNPSPDAGWICTSQALEGSWELCFSCWAVNSDDDRQCVYPLVWRVASVL